MDLSTTTDLTCVAFAFPQEDETHILKLKFWIPQDNMEAKSDRDHVQYDYWVREGFIEATPGAVTDYSYAHEYVRECCEIHTVAEIAYDRWNATQLVGELEDDGITMIPFGQGFQSMSPASKSFEALLLQHKIQHNDNPVLKWMANNVAIQSDAAGNIKPVKDPKRGRIDGIIASIMALDRAVRNNNGPSVYETRGLRTV
jgi:phage terminase large subunit-like protein